MMKVTKLSPDTDINSWPDISAGENIEPSHDLHGLLAENTFLHITILGMGMGSVITKYFKY